VSQPKAVQVRSSPNERTAGVLLGRIGLLLRIVAIATALAIGRVPRSGGVEGVVVNLSDVQRAGRYGATSSAVALLTSLGWRSSSLIGLSKAIDPSERSRRSAICHSS
jgi:hypothetical protein